MMTQRPRSSVVGRQIVVLTVASLLAVIAYTFNLALVGRASQVPSPLSQIQELMVHADGSVALGRSGRLLTPRLQHTATALKDGRVIIAGGQVEVVGPSARAEVYDPASATSRPLPDMSTTRAAHTATLLNDGRVLVAGGFRRDRGPDAEAEELKSAEIFDPVSGSWSAAPSMRSPRALHTGTLLHDGRVLLVGGSINVKGIVGAELFAPLSNTWSDAGGLSELRVGHTATLLADGRVLVVGGTHGGPEGYLNSTLIFDPATDRWSEGPALTVGRSQHSATLLDDGRVLVTGGLSGNAMTTGSTEIYDPSTGAWTAGPTLTTPRVLHVAAKLPGGRVLIAGGSNRGSLISSVELFDPVRMTWYDGGQVGLAATSAAATQLANGGVLISGGLGFGAQQPLAEAAVAYAGTDDYPSNLHCPPHTLDQYVDPWGFYSCECTSFAAWRMQRDGHTIHNTDSGGHYGNAWHWWTNAIALGIPTTTVKVTGAVAQSDSIGTTIWDTDCNCWHVSGHVAYEETPSSSTVEDYNWAGTGLYAEHTWDPGRYILFGHSIVLTSNSFSFSSPGNGGSLAGPSTWLGGGYYTWEIRTTGSAGNFASKVWQSLYLGPDTYTSIIYEVVSGGSSSTFDFKGKVCGSFYGCSTLDWGNINLATDNYTAWSRVYN